MVSQFREFLLKTNALALAIGVIIGTALGTVVNSLVNDIIMPPVGVLLGGVDFGQLKIVLKQAVGGDPTTEVAIRWGAFVNAIIAFMIQRGEKSRPISLRPFRSAVATRLFRNGTPIASDSSAKISHSVFASPCGGTSGSVHCA